MKISAVIAEYNPFHNGHKYLIDNVKSKSDIVIVIMSSSFTQRGTPAIIDKYKRSLIAVENGADIVLELPCIYSCSNAEIFAKGAVFILNSLNIVDTLYFGAEDSIYDLNAIENKISDNKECLDLNIKKYLAEGFSHLVSREKSLDFLNEKEKEILKKPNNILAFEYIKALKHFNSDIKPAHVKRIYADHNSSETFNNFSSGTYLRNLILNNKIDEIKSFMPLNSYNAVFNSSINDFNNYFNIFKYLVLKGDINYNSYFDYENGMENRFIKYLKSENIYDFIDNVSTKRYTKSRISRLINNIILDINKNLIRYSFKSPYVRVLAMNGNGGKVLKKINSTFILDKFSKINTINDPILQSIAKKEVLATNLYNEFTDRIFNEDYYKSPYFIKK